MDSEGSWWARRFPFRFSGSPCIRCSPRQPRSGWSEIGKIEEFASLTAPMKRLITVEQRDGWRKIVSEKAIYILPAKDGVVRILSPICPHLGCSIPWIEAKQQFICPCHTAIFALDGKLVFRSISAVDG